MHVLHISTDTFYLRERDVKMFGGMHVQCVFSGSVNQGIDNRLGRVGKVCWNFLRI